MTAPNVIRHPRGGGVSKGLGPAAGTNQGATPLQNAVKVPPKVVIEAEVSDILINQVHDVATIGLYFVLRNLADFESGEVLGILNYAGLIALATPPRPQQGPRRAPPSYEQIRRMLRDLEYFGLVSRDSQRNAEHGQLRLYLPHVSKNAERHREKKRAQRNSQQELPQAPTRRKAA